MDLATEYVPLDDLRPHPANPRNGDTDAIARSLAANGQFRPIVVARDGTILAGNHTYAAAAELGWARLAVVRLPLSPDEPRALRIMAADNRTHDLGRYDDGTLYEFLRVLDAADAWAGTGYERDDLDDLAARLDEAAKIDLSRLGTPPPIEGRPTSYGDGNTRYTPNFGEEAEGYLTRATRMIVLNASPTGYAWLVTGLARIAAERYAEPELTNVEVVARLVSDALGEPRPADLLGDVDRDTDDDEDDEEGAA